MKWTLEQINTLENPYEYLNTEDALSTHHNVLNALSLDQMIALASKIMLQCPAENLESFAEAMKVLVQAPKDEPDFYTVLHQAFEVRTRINALMDLSHKAPYLVFASEDLDRELFIVFHGLVLSLLAENESKIAAHLAQTTPEQECSPLARTINTLFSGSEFAAKVGQALAFRREVTRLLLGEHPEQFFSSAEFSIDTCLEFSPLFTSLIAGHEEAIGAKLARVSDAAERSVINRSLAIIGGALYFPEGPFPKIASEMNKPKEAVVSVSEPESSREEAPINPYVAGSLMRMRRSPSDPFFYNDATSSDSDEDESCCAWISRMMR